MRVVQLEKDSEMVENRFSKAIRSYDGAATAQNRIVKSLFNYIDKERAYENILEIGAGSGNLTKEIATLDYDAMYVNDICPEIAEFIPNKVGCADNISFIVGNAEFLEFGSDVGLKFDLVVSSSTFQWFENLETFFCKMYSSLNYGGEFIFSTFVKGNFGEINEITGVGLEYFDLEEIVRMVEKVGFTPISCDSEVIKLNFSTPLDVLKHIKLTGVNSISSQRWTRANLELFEREYINRYSTEKGVVLTYTPIYIRAIKRV